MLSKFAKEFVDDTSGATAVEYGLILALIALAMLAALQGVADTTTKMWNSVRDKSVSAMNKN